VHTVTVLRFMMNCITACGSFVTFPKTKIDSAVSCLCFMKIALALYLLSYTLVEHGSSPYQSFLGMFIIPQPTLSNILHPCQVYYFIMPSRPLLNLLSLLLIKFLALIKLIVEMHVSIFIVTPPRRINHPHQVNCVKCRRVICPQYIIVTCPVNINSPPQPHLQPHLQPRLHNCYSRGYNL
jgi:hypothetical protein